MASYPPPDGLSLPTHQTCHDHTARFWRFAGDEGRFGAVQNRTHPLSIIDGGLFRALR
jgi:hypothetical protein